MAFESSVVSAPSELIKSFWRSSRLPAPLAKGSRLSLTSWPSGTPSPSVSDLFGSVCHRASSQFLSPSPSVSAKRSSLAELEAAPETVASAFFVARGARVKASPTMPRTTKPATPKIARLPVNQNAWGPIPMRSL